MDESLHHQHDTEDDGFDEFRLADDGTYPNNPRLGVVVYRDAVPLATDDHAAEIESLFLGNGWEHPWRNGIFPYHHYHATAHEVLGIAEGSVTVQLGGDEGPLVDLESGDVVVLPAGTAHRNIASSDNLVVIGAYPPGQIWDMNTGSAGERPRVDREIAAVPLPATDPVFGAGGPIVLLWTQ
jgi:uncharacterized protein YjlB